MKSKYQKSIIKISDQMQRRGIQGCRPDFFIYKKNRTGTQIEHFHDCYELDFVLCGSGELYSNGRSYIFKKNSVILGNQFEMHNMKYTATVETVIVQFQSSIIQNTVGKSISWLLHPFLHPNIEYRSTAVFNECESRDMRKLLDMMFDNFEKRQEAQDEMLYSLLRSLLIIVYRNYKQVLIRLGQSTEFPADHFIAVFDFIEKNYMDPDFKINSISEGLHISRPTVNKIFSKYMNSTIKDYITKKRISLAKQILVQNTETLGSVALLCGYNELSAFTRNFKKVTGCSPGEYREKNRADKYCAKGNVLKNYRFIK